jgi:hypothetical protein
VGRGTKLVEPKDIQVPKSIYRAMASPAEAEREKRTKSLRCKGESMPAAALGNALDTMMTHPLALQPRSAIGELGNFLACETAAAQGITPRPAAAKPPVLRPPM